MIETEAQLSGERLGPEEVFNFACHPGLACFNTCCAHKRLPVLPYDLLRLRRGLGLSSQDVLERLLELDLDPVSGWPVLRLKLDDEGRCPLVGQTGCTVYPHRPAACRVYPLARAVAASPRGRRAGEVFLRQETPACLGWREQRPLTVESWVSDQGLEPYHQANDDLLGLFFHPQRQGRRLELQPAQIHAVIMALYNLDVFRHLVGQADFAKRHGFKAHQVREARQRDEDLLLLGRDWLMKQLFV